MGESEQVIPQSEIQGKKDPLNLIPDYIKPFVKTDEDKTALQRLSNLLENNQFEWHESDRSGAPTHSDKRITIANIFEDLWDYEKNGVDPFWFRKPNTFRTRHKAEII